MVFGLNVRIPLDGLLRFKGVDVVQDYVNEVVNYKKSGARDEDLVRVQVRRGRSPRWGG